MPSSLEKGELRHSHSYNIRVGLIKIILHEHVGIWVKDSVAFQLCDSIGVFGSC
jgi:hypothetical protein